jgi:hypothetical protein
MTVAGVSATPVTNVCECVCGAHVTRWAHLTILQPHTGFSLLLFLQCVSAWQGVDEPCHCDTSTPTLTTANVCCQAKGAHNASATFGEPNSAVFAVFQRSLCSCP